ncbi:MAG TPA: TonB-dependent receptor [Methylibium sp.]|nr:TonB-dependent receptor [Methylibium sp.]
MREAEPAARRSRPEDRPPFGAIVRAQPSNNKRPPSRTGLIRAVPARPILVIDCPRSLQRWFARRTRAIDAPNAVEQGEVMAQTIKDRCFVGTLVLALGGFGADGAPAAGSATQAAPRARATGADLVDLSLEDLANIEISSVSRRAERLSDAAASVFVITADDIRRSGATSIAEALRLAPNLQVARIDASQYAISARGFNSSTANKLLVLLDGRSLYTPLFSGVFWDVQDTLLEDIDRIEVISGPGATLWGANAVNGVISIITRDARDSRGALAYAQGGDQERGTGVRYGQGLGDDVAYRLFAKHLERDDTHRADGLSAGDAWRIGHAGFRVDAPLAQGRASWLGDIYDGRIDQPVPGRKRISGYDLQGHWRRQLADAASVELQLYVDHTERDYPGTFAERRDTWDLQFQHRFSPYAGHDTVWGAGLRSSHDDVTNSALLAFLPAETTLKQFSVFVQDSWQWVPERWTLTWGVRADRNDYSGVDLQPSLRVAWKPAPEQLLWAALARSARAPSRIDRDLYSPSVPPFLLAGGPDFQSEIVNTAELGYRLAHAMRGSLSATLFYSDYAKLRSLQPTNPPAAFPLVLTNRIEGHAYGLETWGDWLLKDWARLRAGYLWQQKTLRVSAGGAPDPSGLRGAGNDPRYQAVLRLSLDLAAGWELDSSLRRVGALPDPHVPAYTALDLRLGWRPRKEVEVSIGGKNLLDRSHPEFMAAPTRSEVERSFYAKVLWSY